MEKLVAMLTAMGFPFAYNRFTEGESPRPPYLCYRLPESDNFSADGIVYFRKSKVQLELYTIKKDLLSERTVEAVLDAREVFYNKTESWIEKEKLYRVLYEFEINLS